MTVSKVFHLDRKLQDSKLISIDRKFAHDRYFFFLLVNQKLQTDSTLNFVLHDMILGAHFPMIVLPLSLSFMNSGIINMECGL